VKHLLLHMFLVNSNSFGYNVFNCDLNEFGRIVIFGKKLKSIRRAYEETAKSETCQRCRLADCAKTHS